MRVYKKQICVGTVKKLKLKKGEADHSKKVEKHWYKVCIVSRFDLKPLFAVTADDDLPSATSSSLSVSSISDSV